MKIVVALDKFKGALTAPQACRIAATALRSALPDAEIILKPMADGGDGAAQALIAARDGQWLPVRALDPLGREIESGIGWLERDRTAIVEMAGVSGLALLKKFERDPMRASSFGTGQLIAAAIEHGAAKIWLGVGGSATVDGGVGAATALDWKFLDATGRPVGPGGGALRTIAAILPSKRKFPPIETLCDVENPLCGPNGAAAVFGPQKGASPAMVAELDAGLRHLADIIKAELGKDILNCPGAGAAGGLAGGALAFFGATLVAGVETIMDAVQLSDALRHADWVITGEGKLDRQSLQGKVVSGVIRRARAFNKPVAIVAGSIALSAEELDRAHVREVVSICGGDITEDQSLKEPEQHLARAIRALAARLARRAVSD